MDSNQVDQDLSSSSSDEDEEEKEKATDAKIQKLILEVKLFKLFKARDSSAAIKIYF